MAIQSVKREYSIHDKGQHETDHRMDLLTVIKTVPDLNNDEVCSIIDLEVGTSIDIDNIIVMRTK